MRFSYYLDLGDNAWGTVNSDEDFLRLARAAGMTVDAVLDRAQRVNAPSILPTFGVGDDCKGQTLRDWLNSDDSQPADEANP